MNAFEATSEATENLPGGVGRVVKPVIRFLAEANPGSTFGPLLGSGRGRLSGTFPRRVSFRDVDTKLLHLHDELFVVVAERTPVEKMPRL